MTNENYDCGPCVNYLCSMYGCMKKQNYQKGSIEFVPRGCVCPPTSEQTCMNPLCPRKDITVK